MLTRRDGLKLTLSLAAWAGAATRLARSLARPRGRTRVQGSAARLRL